VLDQLLGAAMEKPDMRIDALHNLAIELEHKAQYAVRRRVLGPEIEGEIAQSRLGHGGLASAAGSTPTADTGSNFIRLQPQRVRHEKCLIPVLPRMKCRADV
jgi:hypothetical protein